MEIKKEKLIMLSDTQAAIVFNDDEEPVLYAPNAFENKPSSQAELMATMGMSLFATDFLDIAKLLIERITEKTKAMKIAQKGH